MVHLTPLSHGPQRLAVSSGGIPLGVPVFCSGFGQMRGRCSSVLKELIFSIL